MKNIVRTLSMVKLKNFLICVTPFRREGTFFVKFQSDSYYKNMKKMHTKEFVF